MLTANAARVAFACQSTAPRALDNPNTSANRRWIKLAVRLPRDCQTARKRRRQKMVVYFKTPHSNPLLRTRKSRRAAKELLRTTVRLVFCQFCPFVLQ